MFQSTPCNDAKLVIAGVTDFSAHHFDPVNRSDPAAALADAPSDVGAKILQRFGAPSEITRIGLIASIGES